MAFIKQRQDSTAAPHGIFERDDDLEAMLGELRETAAADELRVVELCGEAGIGKTRLISAIVAAVEQGAAEDTRVGVGRARGASTVTSPFQPFRGVVDDLEKRYGKRGHGRIKAAVDALKTNFPEVVASAPVIGQSLKAGMLVGKDYRAGRSGDTLAQDMARCFIEFFGTVAEDAPLALVLDDMHWGDQSSTDFLLELSEALPSVAMALSLLKARLAGLERDRDDATASRHSAVTCWARRPPSDYAGPAVPRGPRRWSSRSPQATVPGRLSGRAAGCPAGQP